MKIDKEIKLTTYNFQEKTCVISYTSLFPSHVCAFPKPGRVIPWPLLCSTFWD